MTTVMKQLHQGASGEQQVRQNAKQVSAVLGEQEVTGHQGETPENPATDLAVDATLFEIRM